MGGPYWMYDLETRAAMAEAPPEFNWSDWSDPACKCCPHAKLSDIERDELLRDVWDNCPDSGCLWQMCPLCEAA
jgi:hypothetical protein